jgi:hypothetical protein
LHQSLFKTISLDMSSVRKGREQSDDALPLISGRNIRISMVQCKPFCGVDEGRKVKKFYFHYAVMPRIATTGRWSEAMRVMGFLTA